MADKKEVDVNSIEDEKTLEDMLKKTVDATLKEKIKKRQEVLKEKKNLGTPASPTSPSTLAQPKMTRNPSAIKQMLLEWCKKQTQGYENVNITNFSGSWADGMAFCALIHHFHPQAFDFSKLNPKNRRGNFTLAFDVAEKYADIAPLLDVNDMVMMKNPDWKCVFTYVQSFYRKFAMQKPASSTSSDTPTSP